jgi:hypothetical protein
MAGHSKDKLEKFPQALAEGKWSQGSQFATTTGIALQT